MMFLSHCQHIRGGGASGADVSMTAYVLPHFWVNALPEGQLAGSDTQPLGWTEGQTWVTCQSHGLEPFKSDLESTFAISSIFIAVESHMLC